MRVLIDTTFARRRPYSGTAIYLGQLIEALGRVNGIQAIEVANPRRRPAAGGGVGSVRNLTSDGWWTSVALPRVARRVGADLIHHSLPARSRLSPVPEAITVHDLAFERLPECFDRPFRTYARHAHRAAARDASAVICVSETTAADVKELWSVDPRRVVVARHGPGQLLAPTPPDGANHFLYVGDREPRKNVPRLIDAYRRYRERSDEPVPLILAGSVSADAPGIATVSYPTSERLGELYAGAAAVIQPSLYEGFGLTALEAMASGAPVIASEIAGLREVCGDAAEYIDPRDPESLAAAMAQLASEPRLRAELSERGRRRAAEFSWESSARAHVDAYSLALARR